MSPTMAGQKNHGKAVNFAAPQLVGWQAPRALHRFPRRLFKRQVIDAGTSDYSQHGLCHFIPFKQKGPTQGRAKSLPHCNSTQCWSAQIFFFTKYRSSARMAK